MKEKTIKELAKLLGEERAAALWTLVVVRLCDGIEPHEGDKFKAEDIAAAFKGPNRDALVKVLCDEQKGSAKGRKFKAEKARSYTAPEIVGFIVVDPTTEGLRAEYMRRTGGIDALLYVGGKIAEKETADRVQRLFDRDPVAPFVVIDGAEVTPVGYPEPDAKQDAEDPYQRGAALGQPGDISARLGVSLDGITHETRQAVACAVENDLADASVRDLQRDAEAAKGKPPAEYLADKPLARRAWPTWKKPSLMLARTPRNPPPAGGDVAPVAGPVFAASPAANGPAPLVVILGHETKAYASVRQSLVPMERVGALSLWSEADIRSGFVGEQRAAAYAQAALFIALLDATTLASLGDTLQTLVDTKRRIVPVLSGACLTEYSAVARLKTLCSDRAYRGDEDGVIVAQAVRAILAQRPPYSAPVRLDLGAIHQALVDSGLTNKRAALLAGVHRSFVSSLTTVQSDSAQALVDLGALQSAGTLHDGSRPLVTYLRAAVALAGPRRETQVFRDALSELIG